MPTTFIRAVSYLIGITLILSSLYGAQAPGVTSFVPTAPQVEANTVELMGYAWSQNLGWISMNCANDSSCASSDYKVTLDATTNNLTGYAWNDTVGWIQFGGLTGCPAGTCDARREGNELRGWARAVMGDGGSGVPPVLGAGTTTFSTVGSSAYPLPVGTYEIAVRAWGGGGGSAFSGTAGGGGGVAASYSVSDSDTVTVTVGAGGAPGTSGGASRVVQNGTTIANAGGGGGTFGLGNGVGGSASVSGSISGGALNGGVPNPPFMSDAAYVAGTGRGASGMGGVGGGGYVSIAYKTSVSAPMNNWDGWISLSCSNTSSCGTSDYGIDIGATDFSGFAWGSDVVGWISTNCLDTSSCASANYRVYLDSLPCGSASYQCVSGNTVSRYTDAWCVTTDTTCNVGEMCRTDMGNLCGPGNPTGQLIFTSQKVRKGSTVGISWPSLAYYDSCRVQGTPSGGITDSWNWSSSTPLFNVTTSPIQSEVTYTLECTQIGDVTATYLLLDTERVTLLPSIREF
jgi:hypothetical protein